jgi:site-specific recombinase XerD
MISAELARAAFESLLPNSETSNIVFLTQNGHDALAGNRHWFEDVVKEAGIRDFTWHDLRHTFASRLIMAGVGLRSVQDLMGHRSINVTAGYTHLEPSQQLAAVEKIAVFSAKTVMQKRTLRKATGSTPRPMRVKAS